ncbi:MAG: MinD/ParA family ATP-binding protein, partial [Candidatus Hadarchaeota archaeon]
VGGVIINRYRGEKEMARYAENAIGKPIMGIIRDSKLIRKCWEKGVPVYIKKPDSKVAEDFLNLGMKTIGKDIPITPYGRLKFLIG